MKVNLLARIKNRLKRMKIVDISALHVTQEVHHLRRLFEYLSVDIVYDVGANHGQYAQMLREKVGYKGVIVSVEPIPEMAEILRRKSENDPLWHIEEIVVSDDEKDYPFNIMTDRECSSLSAPILTDTSAYVVQTKIEKTIIVKGVTFDALFKKWGNAYLDRRRPYLKLDTQGHDLKILIAAEFARAHLVAFQSELSIKRLYESSTPIEQVLDIYKKFGYDISALVPNNAGHFPDLIEIDCIMIRSDLVS